jgi:hypothetical protein
MLPQATGRDMEPTPARHGAGEEPRAVSAESDAGTLTLSLAFVATLGRGRGARVDLVRDLRSGRSIAEKVFGCGRGLSPYLTRALYRLCYQAPFPYRSTADAVWAAYYRRKALRLLTTYWFGAPCVADALYVRWDAVANAFVLGTEYIAGRGPRLSPPDPRRLLRWLGIGALPPRVADDMDGLLAFMERLRRHLRDSGFIGAQWQVDRRTLVATANCLFDGTKWVLVDLESGVPALTLPRYLLQGLRAGRLPLFDDTDFAAVWSYVDRHSRSLAQSLGVEGLRQLRHCLKELEAHEHLWKGGEVAVLRQPGRWLRRADRMLIRRQTVARWVREGRVSLETAPLLEASAVRFLGHWALGTTLRRLRHGLRFLRDRAYRAAVIAPFVATWVRDGRIGAEAGAGLLREPRLLPLALLMLTAPIPAPLLRFARDAQYRAEALRRAYRMLCDDQYQMALAVQYIHGRIAVWEAAQRLTAAEAQRLRQAVATPSAQEYIRGFGVHLALKALLPSALLDPLLVGTAVATGSLYPLALLLLRSLAISVYTAARWLKRPDVGRGIAFAVGLVPKLSILAYPGQLLTVHPELAAFLVRDLAARVGERLPIYGGRHTLTEHLCIQCAELPLRLAQRLIQLATGGCAVDDVASPPLGPSCQLPMGPPSRR